MISNRTSFGTVGLLCLLVGLGFMGYLGCTGQAGPAGPSGSTGSPGPNTYQATFQNGVFPTSGYSGELDTWLNGGGGSTNAAPYLEVNTGATYSNYGRAVLKFDVSSLPVNAQVATAEVLLKLNPGTAVGSSPVTVGLHNFTSNTNPGCHWVVSATWLSWGGGGWNSCTGDGSSGQEGYINPTTMSTVVFSSSVNGTNGVYRWRIDPAVVQAWLTSSTNNNGLILKSEGEFGETTSTVGFYPYNDATASNHAQLIVTYQ